MYLAGFGVWFLHSTYFQHVYVVSKIMVAFPKQFREQYKTKNITWHYISLFSHFSNLRINHSLWNPPSCADRDTVHQAVPAVSLVYCICTWGKSLWLTAVLHSVWELRVKCNSRVQSECFPHLNWYVPQYLLTFCGNVWVIKNLNLQLACWPHNLILWQVLW